MMDLQEMGVRAKQAASVMARTIAYHKDEALKALAKRLLSEKSAILKANQDDVKEAKEKGMSEAMLDRLILEERLEMSADDVLQIANLPDPIGEIFEGTILPNGLRLSKCRTPIGVLGIIYEARPNVTIDVAALAIKTGNCAILRGGSETLRSNTALVQVIQKALQEAELPPDAIQLIESSDRQLVKELLHLHQYVDLIIPRGGAGLHQFCRENSTIPVITGGIGVCHLYVDEQVDPSRAIPVIHNAKTQRPTVCNSLDTLLVNEKIADTFIPMVIDDLNQKKVSFRFDPKALKIVEPLQSSFAKEAQPAEPKDWDTEWLGLTLGIKVVANLEEAITHIQKHSTGHSDGILTNSKEHAEQFIHDVDSAVVYVNASTRFTDGGQFGLGAEVAISTQKLHARGPMGLKELTSYKWIVKGDYQIRQ